MGENSFIRIKSVLAAVNVDKREQTGSFSCNDELVNKIYDVAAYTTRLCMQNGYFWDGIKRDRLVWIGDLYPEMRSAFCLFGDVPETDASLTYSENESVLPDWTNTMAPYSLWWLIILCENYKHNGDKDVVLRHMDYVKGLIKQINPLILEDGSTDYPMNFIDWPTHFEDNPDSPWKPAEGEDQTEKYYDELAGMYYLNKTAFTMVRELLVDFGEDVTTVDDILLRLSRKKHTVLKYKQIAGFAALNGDLSDDIERVLVDGGAKGMSTFMSYIILTGVALFGKFDLALTMMKDYYGGMLEAGATSFWEDFNVDWLKEDFFRTKVSDTVCATVGRRA
ncbi:MAG: hypothetical protein MJ072_02225 [Clostridia bacterium]|nr:hypothetical protein [Clostridia bacterium]